MTQEGAQGELTLSKYTVRETDDGNEKRKIIKNNFKELERIQHMQRTKREQP